ncbi:hypothetical protein BaRGS_00028785 [Batillaria attramentaria]|uniref:non-specific serine/threonine protein kinase n=1 Tax=Batillaria attramentaria TaxID=370345 RepID=A0ABD0JYH7_9CAEN
MEGGVPSELRQRCEKLHHLSDGDNGADLTMDCLLDSFLALYDECQQDSLARNKNIAMFLKKYNEAVKKTKDLCIKPSDFEVKATVGHGHFGEVQVVHEKTTDTVYAMKVLRKSDLLAQPDISFFEEERDIMAHADSPWLTKLHFAFQDSSHLYLVMDFHPGGDLLSLLSRFYLAEMAVAINDLHEMGYLHRDIKPENVLLDHAGHIKLADFGSAAKMDANRQVSSRMPVGTPDYVAPELLDSMNRTSRSQCYGPEVDWWSLGICAYEMMFGSTPFTDDAGSMVATYGNIMNFKDKLRFPSNTSVSPEAKDFIRQLLSNSMSRLTWSEIKQHPFFRTIPWSSIGSMQPPFVPSISSLDDTSNFDEVEKPKPPPCLDSFQPSSRSFTGRNLPFVGFTFCRCERTCKLRSPKKSVSNMTVFSDSDFDSSVGLNTARYISQVESCTSVASPNDSRASRTRASAVDSEMEVTVKVKISEMRELKGRCDELESARRSLEERVEALEAEKTATEKELKAYVTKNQELSHELEQEKERSLHSDRESVEAWTDLQAMNSQISSLEDQMLSLQLDELREIIVQLESEQEGLTRRLLQKDQQLEAMQKSLNTAQQQLATKQLKLDKERRKSRDGQRQNLALLESHDESWLKQLEEKQATIEDLNRKVRDLEDLVAAYEEQEDEQAGELQQLHYKLNTSLLSTGVDASQVDLSAEGASLAHMQVKPVSQGGSAGKRVSLQVTVKPGRRSVRDNKTVEKLKDLQAVVDRYSREAQSWRQREDELQRKVTRLEGELRSQRQKEGVTQQTKDTLMNKVHVYQQEVHMQRKLIKELQKKMRSYLDEQTTLTQTEAKLKELQCQNLDLEGELFTVRQETEHSRQLAMDKTREMEDIISKLEQAQKQVVEYQDKTKELEEQVGALSEERGRLETQVKSLLDQVESLQGLVDEGKAERHSLTARNTDLQRQLQELTKRNADLSLQVESLQKVSVEEEKTASSRAELNTQLNRLQQHNDELQRQVLAANRERRTLEDQTQSLQREAERLNRRIGRLESVEVEKRQLESKLERLGTLEREKKRLELRLSRMDDLEQERTQLQLKLERFEMDNKKLNLDLQEVRAQKKDISAQLNELRQQHDAHSKEKAVVLTSKGLRVDLLRSEKEELERQVKELKVLNVSAKELRDELSMKETEVKDLKVMITNLEGKMDDLEQQLKVKASEVSRLQREKGDLEKEVTTLKEGKKPPLDRTGSIEVKSRLVERLQQEKAELQKQLETMEKERDSLRLATPSRVRDSGSRNSLCILRESGVKLRADLEDKVQRLERVVRELEKKLRISSATAVDKNTLQKEIEQLRVQIRLSAEAEAAESALQSELESVQKSRDSFKQQVQDLQQQVDALTQEKRRLERSAASRTSSDREKKNLTDRIQTLERDKRDLERKVTDMEQERKTFEAQIEAERKRTKEESEKLKTATARTPASSNRLVGELTQEKQSLEAKVKSLERQLESLQKRRQSGDLKTKAVTDLQEEKADLEAEVRNLTAELSRVKEEAAQTQRQCVQAESKSESLEAQVKDLAMDASKLREQIATLQASAKLAAPEPQAEGEDGGSLRQQNAYLETKVEELEKHLERANTRPSAAAGAKMSQSAVVAELRQELHESNLAVSEARSLLSAAKRQETELRERVHKLQRALDNGAVSRASNIQMAHGAEHELRVLRSQYETLQRQYQNLEERQNGSHRDKAATVMEVTLLRDQLQTKQHQLDMEVKKTHKLTALCTELEEQVKDMEVIISQSEKQEAEWNDIRQTYEKAVTEREQELEGANERLQAVTSARMSVDSRVSQLSQQLESVKAAHRAETEKMSRQLEEERAKSKELTATVSALEEKNRQYQQVLKAQGQNIEAENDVIRHLKEEISQKTTEMYELKTLNVKLRKHLDQAMDKFELIFGEKVSLENFNEALQGLHFLEKYKFESTIGQQMKLIDYLQDLYMENAGKKKKGIKKLGSTRGKDPAVHLDCRSVDRFADSPGARAEKDGQTSGAARPTSQPRSDPVAMATTWQPHPQPPQRMHHNIPHRFVTGLNTRATKCGLCLGSVHFVKQASKCEECGLVVHPKCASSVPATCGLPTEYVRYFADMMSQIEEAEARSLPEPVSIKMEGWLKVPRTGKPGWEKRWVELDGLMPHAVQRRHRRQPCRHLRPVHPRCRSERPLSGHGGRADQHSVSDLYYVLRLDQDPLTTCWPGRYLYLMTTNFSEKQRWVASLEAATPQMTTVVSLKEVDRKEFNSALVLSSQIVLLGTDDGLFALNPQSTSGRQYLVQLTGFGSVHQIAEAKGVNMVLLLTGCYSILPSDEHFFSPERRLVMVDSKLIKCRMSQTIGGETTPFSYKPVEGIQSCTVFNVAVFGDASYLCVGTPDKPCSCMCIAEGFAIVGTERFYRISLEHPSMIDFVDRQDSSLAFAAFGAANHHSFPLAVVQVSPEGLPLEFLLCFHEFGVFVDHRGQRSRQSDIKWSGLPLSFSYNEPFLYITYFNSLQATVVPTDKEQVKGCQTAVDLPAPRYLGKAEDPGAVYVATSCNGITEVIHLRAKDRRRDLTDSDDEKENLMMRQVRFASPDKGGIGGFRVKTSVSLLSLDSTSSSSTFTSVESTF